MDNLFFLKYKKHYLFFTLVVLIFINSVNAQTQQPVAKFSFNDQKNFDEISQKKVRFAGTSYALDRFGNENSAVYLHGNQYSYINLGNYPALKCKSASISLWLNVSNEIWAGQGYTINPVILTKSCNKDDFFESYAIYYMPEGDNIGCCLTKDSTNQMGIPSATKFERFKWHHLVLTYNKEGMAFYIDGKKQGEFTTGFAATFSKTDSVLIGSTGNQKNNRFLNGFIDDVAFYDRVITAEEVEELFNAPNPNKNKIILNWFLRCLVMIVFILIIYFIVKHRVKLAIQKERSRLELNNKLLETELRVNRASMNPHFLFNSLNALHNFVLAKEIDNASNYLIKFSKLIRKILDSNMHESVSLNLEIELLEQYLELEKLRFDENIQYTIVTEDSLVSSIVRIPIMMLQPFVENAIWHGLLNKDGDKKISIAFSMVEDKYIFCVIEDNGIGRKEIIETVVEKKSMAIAFIKQRLELLNKIHNLNCSLIIEDKINQQGTIVKIILPILKN